MFFNAEKKHRVTYGNTIISFTVNYSPRKTMAIAVYPDSKVEITAPENLSLDLIHTRVERRGSWILKQIRKYTRNEIVKRDVEWLSGETVYYLGRQYRLKVLKGEPVVKLAGKFLWVFVPDKADLKAIKQLVDGWYKQHAIAKFNERLLRLAHVMEREKVQPNKLIVRTLEKRWGSCSEQGNILLNTDLVKVPVDCIDYVLVHEICHLKYLNHGKKFYQSLERNCIDWERKKEKLEQFAGKI